MDTLRGIKTEAGGADRNPFQSVCLIESPLRVLPGIAYPSFEVDLRRVVNRA